MFDPTPASLAGVRRHDLPRSASGRAPAMPAEAGIAGLASSIERHLAAARRTRQPLAVLTIAVRRCQQIDGEPVPTLLHPLALEAGQRLRARVRGTDTVLWQSQTEFAVVLNDCRHDRALIVLRRLLTGLGEPYQLGSVRVVPILISGCACHPAAGDTGALLLDAALQARGPVDPP